MLVATAASSSETYASANLMYSAQALAKDRVTPLRMIWENVKHGERGAVSKLTEGNFVLLPSRINETRMSFLYASTATVEVLSAGLLTVYQSRKWAEHRRSVW
jgi:hypothetical protein